MSLFRRRFRRWFDYGIRRKAFPENPILKYMLDRIEFEDKGPGMREYLAMFDSRGAMLPRHKLAIGNSRLFLRYSRYEQLDYFLDERYKRKQIIDLKLQYGVWPDADKIDAWARFRSRFWLVWMKPLALKWHESRLRRQNKRWIEWLNQYDDSGHLIPGMENIKNRLKFETREFLKLPDDKKTEYIIKEKELLRKWIQYDRVFPAERLRSWETYSELDMDVLIDEALARMNALRGEINAAAP